VDSGLCCSCRNAQDLGNLVGVETCVVTKDDGDSVFRLQAPEASLQLISIGRGATHIRSRRRDASEVNVLRNTPARSALVGAGVYQHAVNPGIELVDIAQARQLLPGLDQRLLYGVLRQLTVAKDQSGDRAESVHASGGQRLEGAVIATLGRLYESSRHPLQPPCTADLAVSN